MVITKRTIIGVLLGAWCISALLQADAYSDRLIKIMNSIANEYDAPAGYLDPENMTAVALQAINFITVENDISKNSPLGRKNKYITQHAQTLQKKVVELLKLIQQSEKIKTKMISKDVVLKNLWMVESKLKQLEGEIAEIPKKQFLPLSKVQKDLINLLALLAAKNLAIAQRMIRNVEAL